MREPVSFLIPRNRIKGRKWTAKDKTDAGVSLNTSLHLSMYNCATCKRIASPNLRVYDTPQYLLLYLCYI